MNFPLSNLRSLVHLLLRIRDSILIFLRISRLWRLRRFGGIGWWLFQRWCYLPRRVHDIGLFFKKSHKVQGRFIIDLLHLDVIGTSRSMLNLRELMFSSSFNYTLISLLPKWVLMTLVNNVLEHIVSYSIIDHVRTFKLVKILLTLPQNTISWSIMKERVTHTAIGVDAILIILITQNAINISPLLT